MFVFISYRSQEPDIGLAEEFYRSLLAAGHQAFMAGRSIRLGENWSRRVDTALEQSDYFLLLLSPLSATSEMVIEEVRRARELRQSRPDGRPVLLPIRVGFPMDAPLNYDLRGYLSRIQQREWRSVEDTQPIIQEVLDLLSEGRGPEETLEPTLVPVSREKEDTPPLPVAEPELPGGQVDLVSAFYIERRPIESDCYIQVGKPGALIRIKAPRQMGKTSLMARILQHASLHNCQSVPLSFQHADNRVFTDLDHFLRWLCTALSRRLRLKTKPAEFWDDTFGSKDNCTAYFEECLLSESTTPLVLGLDEVDLVFQHPTIAADFFGLLRAWHEEAKNLEIWKKLRLVITYSTEAYIPLSVYQSPFNVGLPAELPEFTLEQVQELARRHGLDWRAAQIEPLIKMIGGHPYLVRVALYHIARGDMTLPQLVEVAPTEAGPFSDHLRRHQWNLEQRPLLAAAIRQVTASGSSVELEMAPAFHLYSMGLVHLEGNAVRLRCDLYRQYFSARLRAR